VFTSCKKDSSDPIKAETIPLPPTLSTPKDTSTNIEFPVVLTWNESNGATSYTLQVSASRSFSSFILDKSGITTTTQQVIGFTYLSVYYWRVSASNSAGTSDWSKVSSFTTMGELAYIPRLSLPANGEIDQKLSPELVWNEVTNANSYILQVSMNSSFTSFVYNLSGLTNTTRQLTALNHGAKYFWRVRATNNFGNSSWSETWSFNTISACEGTKTVLYGNKLYNTVSIANQCWMKENLDIGDIIPQSREMSDDGVIEKYCPYDRTESCDMYGGLYQWDEAMKYGNSANAQGICPTGWHMPTKVDFELLAAAVSNDGNALKAIGQGSLYGAGTNTSGFSALFAGGRYVSLTFYGGVGNATLFWSTSRQGDTLVYCLSLAYDMKQIFINYSKKKNGFSIRCIKD
jgi:uncharacterized protein (TIGR02145 family)